MARHTSAAGNSYLYRLGVPVSAPPLTLSVWAKMTTAAQFVANLCYGAANGWFNIGSTVTDIGKAAAYHYDGTNIGLAKTIAIPSATWVHLAAVFASNGSRSVFVNGANKVTDTVAVSATTIDRVFVGSAVVGGSVYGPSWDGDIAEFAIYNAALADADVALLASGKSAGLVQAGTLAAYYKLLGAADPEPDEKGGTGLTVQGATAATHPPIDYGTVTVTGRMFHVF